MTDRTAAQGAAKDSAISEPTVFNRWVTDWGNVVIPVFLAAALIPNRSIDIFIPTGPLPPNSLGAIALILIGAFSRPRWPAGNELVRVGSVALVLWLVLGSAILHEPEMRRSINLLSMIAVAAVIGSGRLPIKSVTKGMAFGMVVAILLSLALLPTSGYEDRLTGVLGDPNGAAFILVALGLPTIQAFATHRARIIFWAVLAIPVLLTLSRTGVFAFSAATAWVLIARRLNRPQTVAALGIGTWLFRFAIDLAERMKLFPDRTGSDLLRDELAVHEIRMVGEAGWLGNGLGTASALVRDTWLYFHNSFRALQVEGGLLVMILLGLFLLGLLWMVNALPSQDRPVWAEAGIIGGLIGSVNIGYSLTSIVFATSVGLYLAYHGAAKERLFQESSESSAPIGVVRVRSTPRRDL